ncbi:MAG: hypothetical protein ABH956_00635 [Candidatus Nealsonbacteria bacterium]
MDYSKEQLDELYENLPENLQEAVFSEKNGTIIYNSCIKNKIEKDEEIKQVSKYVGYVLLGLLSPNDFQKSLEEKVGIKKEKAIQIYSEINRSIFFSVKNSLEALYEIKLKDTPIKITKDSPILKNNLKSKDTYREPIE